MLSYFIQQTLNGVQLGTVYALIALGYTMVYGIIKLINFAHADIFMVGAYIAFFIGAFYLGINASLSPNIWLYIALAAGYMTFYYLLEVLPFLKKPLEYFDSQFELKDSWWQKAIAKTMKMIYHTFCVAAIAAIYFPVIYYPSIFLFKLKLGAWLFVIVVFYVMAVTALIGVTMERLAYRPLRHKPRLSALITALGVSLFLEYFGSTSIVFDSTFRAFPEIVKQATMLRIESLDISISNIFFINISILIVLLSCLWLLVEKTLIGKQMRAVAVNSKVASLMGIDVDKIIGITFIIGPGLAGASGILFGINYGALQSPLFGFMPGIKAFIAAVLGGIGSLPGAVIGAIIMGTTEMYANSINSNLGFAAAFVILIIILLFRPNGIMGRKEIDKV